MDSNSKAHLLAVPFSVAGHVKPLLNLCHRIAAEGIRVTFVTTESIHAKIIAGNEDQLSGKALTFASVPDGLENDTERADILKFKESIKRVMPGHLMELAQKSGPITAVIADATVGWTLDVAEKIGARQFGFWLVAPGCLAHLSSLPKLNEGTLLNTEAGKNSMHGSVTENIQIDDESSRELRIQKTMSDMARYTQNTILRVEYILCNTFYDLDSSSCKLVPKLLPVGPLKSLSTSRKVFLEPEDTSCLEWLGKKQTNSVIYVAFGGTGVLSHQQFHELALGLELTGRSFLWVVRSDLVHGSTHVSYPDGFLERISDNGKIVEWAPQEKVLAHPATACFLSHCGWNSIMEGISFGVPFLCWPYFGDQFYNQQFISDVLKVALKLDADENGVKSREEISNKIEMLLSDAEIKANVLKLKNLGEKSISKEGSSYQNLQSFINQLKH